MATTVKSWTDKKEALKFEICSYFKQISDNKSQIVEACAHIKKWGEIHAEMQVDGFSYEPCTVSDECVENYFSPAHRESVAAWINQYADLYLEALKYLEGQRTWGKCWARDDFEYEDWAQTQPSGEIQVCGDKIRVLSFGFIEGFAQNLPKKGKKSIGRLSVDGGWEWNYPLSELEAVKGIGLPVIYAIDAEK